MEAAVRMPDASKEGSWGILMKKKIVIIVSILMVLAVVAFVVYWEINHGNRSLIDMKNRFDRAVIRLPDGSCVEGRISSWLDYNDSDIVQITIDGRTYLTHYSNVCLIDD